MTTKKTFKVTYTKKIGGVGSILVVADNANQAIQRAAHLCYTGSDFRNAEETDEIYEKPRKQGFYGRH